MAKTCQLRSGGLQLIIIFLASLIPGIFWVKYFRDQDHLEKEPLNLLALTFIAGALAVIPAAIFEFPFRDILSVEVSLVNQILVSFFVIGLGEELFKAIAVYVTVYRNQEFNEPLDGIIYGATVGVGFSVVENMLYTAAFGLSVAPIRAIIASLAHACFSGIFGIYCGRAKFSEHPWIELAKGLLYAGFFHGLYDFILISQVISPFFSIGLVGVLYLGLRKQIKSLTRASFK